MLRFFRPSFNEFRMSGKTDPPDPGDRLPAHSELVEEWDGCSAHSELVEEWDGCSTHP